MPHYLSADYPTRRDPDNDDRSHTFRSNNLTRTVIRGTVTMEDKKTLIVSLSGCSSSGKTTLARLLRDIFPDTFILHEDDFYKPEEQ